VCGGRTRRRGLAHTRAFATKFGIPRVFTDYRRLVECPDVDLVVIGAPNDLHCPMTLAAAAAGKHVVCDKLRYDEELCFAAKYVRLEQLLDEVALGCTRRTSGTSAGLAAALFRNPGKGV
jgi:hypothetical protein